MMLSASALGFSTRADRKRAMILVNFGYDRTPPRSPISTVNEFSIGAGYKVSDKLKLGLAWRWVMAGGNLSIVSSMKTQPVR